MAAVLFHFRGDKPPEIGPALRGNGQEAARKRPADAEPDPGLSSPGMGSSLAGFAAIRAKHGMARLSAFLRNLYSRRQI